MSKHLPALAAALALAIPAFAADAHHPEKVATPAPTVKQMQDNVNKMQAQLKRLAQARTDARRQEILAEHLHTLEANLALGKSLAGDDACPMMGGAAHGRMMPGGMGMGDGDRPGMMERMQQMERRMDMMQQMMQERGPASPPPPAGQH